MAFKLRTEVKQSGTPVTVTQIPEDFLAAIEAEYAAVTADPTREVILAGETPQETTLYVQWAKAWGVRHDPELFVTKQPARKSDDKLDARLNIVLKSQATPRGRRTAKNAVPVAADTAKTPKGK